MRSSSHLSRSVRGATAGLPFHDDDRISLQSLTSNERDSPNQRPLLSLTRNVQCVCIYIYMHMHTHRPIPYIVCKYVPTCIQRYIQAHMYLCMYIRVCIQLRMHTCMYVHTCMYIHLYIHIYINVYSFIFHLDLFVFVITCTSI